MEKRIEDLEIRLTHQDAAVDELTRANIKQAREMMDLRMQIEALKAAVESLSPPLAGQAADEPPPPHY